MITMKDYMMGRDVKYPPSTDVKVAAANLLTKVNELLRRAGFADRKLTSGYRPAEINATVPGAAAKSKHMTGHAIDIEDADGKLDAWCLSHLEELEDLGLYLEDPESTVSWAHLQDQPPKSGRRVFKP